MTTIIKISRTNSKTPFIWKPKVHHRVHKTVLNARKASLGKLVRAERPTLFVSEGRDNSLRKTVYGDHRVQEDQCCWSVKMKIRFHLGLRFNSAWSDLCTSHSLEVQHRETRRSAETDKPISAVAVTCLYSASILFGHEEA
jgi:hypothetical protein